MVQRCCQGDRVIAPPAPSSCVNFCTICLSCSPCLWGRCRAAAKSLCIPAHLHVTCTAVQAKWGQLCGSAVATDGCVFAGAMPIRKATIVPRGHALGMVSYLPEADKYDKTREVWGASGRPSPALLHIWQGHVGFYFIDETREVGRHYRISRFQPCCIWQRSREFRA